jgi:2-dehydro-3-deoxyphosphogluconate aldolase/(4S)-4-hydroxy-2-oxoglutarate aldolase
MPYLKLMPTGGVDLSTAAAFIKAGAAALGAGAALVDSAAIEKRDWATITNLAREFRAAVKAARGQG